MGLGTLVSYVLKLTGLKFPSYIGAMLVAAAIRNYSDFTGKFKVYFMEIQEIGEASLSFFFIDGIDDSLDSGLYQLLSAANVDSARFPAYFDDVIFSFCNF